LFTSNILKGAGESWGAFYGDLMAGVATPAPEKASEGRRWNDDEHRLQKGADIVFPDQNSGVEFAREIMGKGRFALVRERLMKFVKTRTEL